jgi:hypothetical protein
LEAEKEGDSQLSESPTAMETQPPTETTDTSPAKDNDDDQASLHVMETQPLQEKDTTTVEEEEEEEDNNPTTEQTQMETQPPIETTGDSTPAKDNDDDQASLHMETQSLQEKDTSSEQHQ